MSLSVLIDAAIGIATLGVTLGGLGGYKGAQTQVQIGIGGTNKTFGGGNLGGSVPHVAIFDEGGSRIGMYNGDGNGHYDESTVKDIMIDNKFTDGKEKQAEYLQLFLHEKDAICMSMVAVAGNGVSWSWLGDMGKTCGAQWYPSNFKLGDGTYSPPCVWLDADHTNGIIARGLSLHMPDFSGQDGRAKQYSDHLDTLCNSAARMQFWPDLDMDSFPPFFNPPLKYTEDGADEDLKRIVDRKGGLYPPTRRFAKRNETRIPQITNLDPAHLVISENPQHSAKEVCEHPNSLGWDFVSTVESTYCDISSGIWWPLCDPSKKVTAGCFDLGAKMTKGGPPGHRPVGPRDSKSADSTTQKSYKSTDVWEA